MCYSVYAADHREACMAMVAEQWQMFVSTRSGMKSHDQKQLRSGSSYLYIMLVFFFLSVYKNNGKKK